MNKKEEQCAMSPDNYVEQLHKEVEELRKDKARIMWFASRAAVSMGSLPPESIEEFRTLIDEAMEEEES